MGGRYDATNILNDNKKSCIITSIGLDHKEYLGNSIKKISKEKAGILKKNNLLICSSQNKKALEVIKKEADNKKCISYYYGKNWIVKNKYLYFGTEKINISRLSLIGDHQYQNIGCAILACYKINALKIEKNRIPFLIKNIKWEGRLHKLNGIIKKKYPNTEYWVDCAHNVLGFQALKKWVFKNKLSELFIILSVGTQKDYKGILNQIKKMKPKLLILIKKTKFNSRSVNDLIIEANNLEIKNKVFNTVFSAIRFVSSINESVNYQRICLIAGSVNLVGEVLAIDNR